MRQGAIVLAGLFLAAHARADDGAAAVLRRFGLEGIWARDCSGPASPVNPRVVWSGALHSITSDLQLFSAPDTITDAVLLRKGVLQFSIGRGMTPSLVMTIQRLGHRMRTLSSVGTDGQVYYADGVELATGTPSVPYERCGEAAPGS